ncbi:MAG: N-acetyltransferase [Anaerolineae bacterium]|jgi:GNAT superfamily N-acetyltransferase|nr:N-acetyltransferase [Anaerolineae bacterium]MDX9832529.1 N-acetyltransferase [Anaerolineae bacterium]
MTGELEIVPVTTEEERRAFARFPWELYRGDPYWVPPIFNDRLALLNPAKHPFYEHATVQLFTARRGGKMVGTVSAHVNHRHNEVYGDKVGFFGFFEVIDDEDVARALLDAAAGWLREQGMDAMRGPESFSQNEEVGLLIDGYDAPPVIMMTYNPRYYQGFIERADFEKVQDLYAWDILTSIFDLDVQRMPRKFLRVAEEARKKEGLVVQRIDMKNFDREVARAKEVYNAAWEKNWGFVPMTDHEIEHLGEELKMVLDPDLIYLAELCGETVGVSLGVPDVNQALLRARPQPNTWSLPLTLGKFLLNRRHIDAFRLMIMGVKPEYRALGIDALFYVETARAAFRKGYKRCEMSWILESNDMMNRIIERLGGTIYKTYRIYQKPIA